MKNIFIKYYSIATMIGESIGYFVVFSLGICRYRLAIYLGISGIVVAIAITRGINKKLLFKIVTFCGLPVLYLDLSKGQIVPIFPQLNIIISVCATLFTVLLINYYVKKTVQKVTNNRIFTYCLNCKFKNSHLVEKCLKCGSTIEMIEIANGKLKGSALDTRH